jgi:hydrogenase/urease accessory protein HupE
MRRFLLPLTFLLLSACAATVSAHEARPAYLQIHQTGADTYDVLWRVPALSDTMRLSLYVQLARSCSNLQQPRGFFADNAYTEQWSVICPGGLAGSTVRIRGLTATLTDALVRLERVDGSSQVTRVVSSSPSFVVEAMPGRFEVARTYLVLGIEHILTGVDHLLFVSGLLPLVNGLRRLLLTVSAFTLSHTVTLTLATLGFVHVPPAPVEAVIALSILFVAWEVLRTNEHPTGLAQRKPWLVALSLGLLHGLGFAGGLSAAGCPLLISRSLSGSSARESRPAISRLLRLHLSSWRQLDAGRPDYLHGLGESRPTPSVVARRFGSLNVLQRSRSGGVVFSSGDYAISSGLGWTFRPRRTCVDEAALGITKHEKLSTVRRMTKERIVSVVAVLCWFLAIAARAQ